MSTPQLQTTTSPLLSLPAELRNEIYKLVLSDEKPLHYRLRVGSTLRLKKPVKISNPFRLVCKAMRQETEVLAVRARTIQIEQHYRCSQETRRCYLDENWPAAFQAITGFPIEWMRRLVLLKCGHQMKPRSFYQTLVTTDFIPTVQLCRRLPKLEVTFVIDRISRPLTSWSEMCFFTKVLKGGLVLNKLVHDEDIFQALIPEGINRKYNPKDKIPELQPWPENLRVKPMLCDLSAEERKTNPKVRSKWVGEIWCALDKPNRRQWDRETRIQLSRNCFEIWSAFGEEWIDHGIGVHRTEQHSALVAWAKDLLESTLARR